MGEGETRHLFFYVYYYEKVSSSRMFFIVCLSHSLPISHVFSWKATSTVSAGFTKFRKKAIDCRAPFLTRMRRRPSIFNSTSQSQTARRRPIW